jgi:hypothetical protein
MAADDEVVLNGYTAAERSALIAATSHECECEMKDDRIVKLCSAHSMLVDERTRNGLLFMRRSQGRLKRGEFKV